MIIGSKILSFNILTSTNTCLTGLLRQHDLPEGTVVTAGFQTGGRGQTGNKWESEQDMNLLFSILLRPEEISAEEQFLLSMTISLGIIDFTDRFVPSATIKWPNDIYVNNDKIAGILIENSVMDNNIDYSVAGIGFNINQEKFISDAPNPVSLRMITGRLYDTGDCLGRAVADLDNRYKQLVAGEFSQVVDDYTSRLFRYNEWSEYSDNYGSFTGRIVSVSPGGLLHVEKKSGKLKRYAFKEIDFIL
jgi:BirA family biotin operon repressor/biotin-[acetyl-CoA-carboxylase] ligase